MTREKLNKNIKTAWLAFAISMILLMMNSIGCVLDTAKIISVHHALVYKNEDGSYITAGEYDHEAVKRGELYLRDTLEVERTTKINNPQNKDGKNYNIGIIERLYKITENELHPYKEGDIIDIKICNGHWDYNDHSLSDLACLELLFMIYSFLAIVYGEINLSDFEKAESAAEAAEIAKAKKEKWEQERKKKKNKPKKK